jgi:hypothetical protein
VTTIKTLLDLFKDHGITPEHYTYNQQSNEIASKATSVPAVKIGGAIDKVSTAPIDGQAWYNQSASRAINQAIGRVIRHKNDWGAIFLLDERFLYDKQLNEVSKWLRPR